MTWSETIRDRAVAAEVTQDVFVWLIHHPDRFDPARGELSSFLLGVAAAGTR
jgi:DNA-directed RNA polymerase specialized sigma24 family protein